MRKIYITIIQFAMTAEYAFTKDGRKAVKCSKGPNAGKWIRNDINTKRSALWRELRTHLGDKHAWYEAFKEYPTEFLNEEDVDLTTIVRFNKD